MRGTRWRDDLGTQENVAKGSGQSTEKEDTMTTLCLGHLSTFPLSLSLLSPSKLDSFISVVVSLTHHTLAIVCASESQRLCTDCS